MMHLKKRDKKGIWGTGGMGVEYGKDRVRWKRKGGLGNMKMNLITILIL